jgi:HNH endonuclease
MLYCITFKEIHMKQIIHVDEGIRIELTRGEWALIDAADLPLVAQYSWHATPRQTGEGYYAATHVNGTTLYMHRLLAAPPAGKEVDHRNGQTLDNRRQNLRYGTRLQNMQNRQRANRNSATGIRGVYVQTNVKTTPPRAPGKPEYVHYSARFAKDGQKYMKLFPYTPEGLAAAQVWLQSERGMPLLPSTNETGIQGITVQRSKRLRRPHVRKDVIMAYNARYMVDGRSYTKNFPYTPDGLQQAQRWVEGQRCLYMEFAREEGSAHGLTVVRRGP